MVTTSLANENIGEGLRDRRRRTEKTTKIKALKTVSDDTCTRKNLY